MSEAAKKQIDFVLHLKYEKDSLKKSYFNALNRENTKGVIKEKLEKYFSTSPGKDNVKNGAKVLLVPHLDTVRGLYKKNEEIELGNGVTVTISEKKFKYPRKKRKTENTNPYIDTELLGGIQNNFSPQRNLLFEKEHTTHKKYLDNLDKDTNTNKKGMYDSESKFNSLLKYQKKIEKEFNDTIKTTTDILHIKFRTPLKEKKKTASKKAKKNDEEKISNGDTNTDTNKVETVKNTSKKSTGLSCFSIALYTILFLSFGALVGFLVFTALPVAALGGIGVAIAISAASGVVGAGIGAAIIYLFKKLCVDNSSAGKEAEIGTANSSSYANPHEINGAKTDKPVIDVPTGTTPTPTKETTFTDDDKVQKIQATKK